MHTSMYIPFILGIVAVVGSFTCIPILTLSCVFFLLLILADAQSDARRASPKKLWPDQFLDDLRLANSRPGIKEDINPKNTENMVSSENIPDQSHNWNRESTKKPNFLEMFEKLSPEEQEKVAQVALQMGKMIEQKWIKKPL